MLNDLDYPVKMRFGMIDTLTMQVPWNSLSTSQVVVHLDGLYVLLGKASITNA